jgi:hypothetical protein
MTGKSNNFKSQVREKECGYRSFHFLCLQLQIPILNNCLKDSAIDTEIIHFPKKQVVL